MEDFLPRCPASGVGRSESRFGEDPYGSSIASASRSVDP